MIQIRSIYPATDPSTSFFCFFRMWNWIGLDFPFPFPFPFRFVLFSFLFFSFLFFSFLFYLTKRRLGWLVRLGWIG